MLGKGLTVLQVRHPPRLYSSQRIAGVKSLGSRILARRSNGRSGSSLLLRLRLVGWKTLSLARSGVPSCRLQARSGSTSRPSSRKMPPGPFQTNLAELGWSDSSGLINLLAVHFLKLKGRMQLTVRSLDQNISYCIQPSSLIPANEDLAEIPCDAKTREIALFFSNLRPEKLSLVLAALAVRLCNPVAHVDSAIRRPDVSSLGKTTDDRYPWTYAHQNLGGRPIQRVRYC